MGQKRLPQRLSKLNPNAPKWAELWKLDRKNIKFRRIEWKRVTPYDRNRWGDVSPNPCMGRKQK